MKYVISLLLALSAGFATYALGAVVWSAIDPLGVGSRLLFTIPIALVGMAIPGLLAALCLVFRCDLIREPRPVKRAARLPRNVRPTTTTTTTTTSAATARAPQVNDDLELALAT